MVEWLLYASGRRIRYVCDRNKMYVSIRKNWYVFVRTELDVSIRMWPVVRTNQTMEHTWLSSSRTTTPNCGAVGLRTRASHDAHTGARRIPLDPRTVDTGPYARRAVAVLAWQGTTPFTHLTAIELPIPWNHRWTGGRSGVPLDLRGLIGIRL